MSKTKIKYDPRAQYHGFKLNPDGSFDYSKIPKLTQQPIQGLTEKFKMGLLEGQHLTSQQRLKIMIQDELDKQNEKPESIFDSFDFEVPDDYSPRLHPAVTTEMVSQAQIKEAARVRKELEQKQKKAAKDAAVTSEGPVKSPVAGNTKQTTKESARKPTEGADDQEE